MSRTRHTHTALLAAALLTAAATAGCASHTATTAAGDTAAACAAYRSGETVSETLMNNSGDPKAGMSTIYSDFITFTANLPAVIRPAAERTKTEIAALRDKIAGDRTPAQISADLHSLGAARTAAQIADAKTVGDWVKTHCH